MIGEDDDDDPFHRTDDRWRGVERATFTPCRHTSRVDVDPRTCSSCAIERGDVSAPERHACGTRAVNRTPPARFPPVVPQVLDRGRPDGHLSVREIAVQLDMTCSGVSYLIKRSRISATRGVVSGKSGWWIPATEVERLRPERAS
ncbi:MAG TPA: hypothetical protein VGL61_31785 [Kofleriaceae bacterium]